VARLDEIHRQIAAIEPASPQFAAEQRRYFTLMEKYLHAGYGSCPLREAPIAQAMIGEFQPLSEWDIDVPHFSIMPNHWHALLVPRNVAHSLSAVMNRLKGRSAKSIRQQQGGHGPVWQREWFDRWIRNDAEWLRCVNYIQ
jgi:putative transposase